jgi:hypothetical protein
MNKIKVASLQCNPTLALASSHFTMLKKYGSPVMNSITHFLAISAHPDGNTKTSLNKFDTRYETYISKHIDDLSMDEITNRIAFETSMHSQHPTSIFSIYKRTLSKLASTSYKKTQLIAPKVHFNLELTLAYSELKKATKMSNKTLWFATFQLPNKFVTNGHKNISKNTPIRRLMEKLKSKLLDKFPDCLAVLERAGGYHIHMIFIAHQHEVEIIRAKIKQLAKAGDSAVQITPNCIKKGVRRPIDLGSANYFAKEINNRYFNRSNLYLSNNIIYKVKASKQKYESEVSSSKKLRTTSGFNEIKKKYKINKAKKLLQKYNT